MKKEFEFKKKEFNLDEIGIDWNDDFLSNEPLLKDFDELKIKKLLRE